MEANVLQTPESPLAMGDFVLVLGCKNYSWTVSFYRQS